MPKKNVTSVIVNSGTTTKKKKAKEHETITTQATALAKNSLLKIPHPVTSTAAAAENDFREHIANTKETAHITLGTQSLELAKEGLKSFTEDKTPIIVPHSLVIEECQIPVYAADIYSSQNFQATQKRTVYFLAQIREQLHIQKGEDFMFIPEIFTPLPCFRATLRKKDVEPTGNISLFAVPCTELEMTPKKEYILMMRQRDGFCCAGATVLTCTAGYTYIEPAMINKAIAHVQSTKTWNSATDANKWTLLPTEGMLTLITDKVGIIPCMIYGKVARTELLLPPNFQNFRPNSSHFANVTTERLEEADDMFQTEEFQYLMTSVRYASILTNDTHHWYSITTIPICTDFRKSAYFVCDPLHHKDAKLYHSYKDFWSNFLLRHIISLNDNIHGYPLTIILYPVIQTQHQLHESETAFIMENLVKCTEETLRSNWPFVSWCTIKSFL